MTIACENTLAPLQASIYNVQPVEEAVNEAEKSEAEGATQSPLAEAARALEARSGCASVATSLGAADVSMLWPTWELEAPGAAAVPVTIDSLLHATSSSM
jgi:hypothetical protein